MADRLSFSRCFSLKRTNELFCFKSSSSLSYIRIEGKSERESMNHIHSPPELLIHILRCVVFEKGDKERELRHYHHWSRTAEKEKRRKVIMEMMMMMIFILSLLSPRHQRREVSLDRQDSQMTWEIQINGLIHWFPHSPSVQISIWIEKSKWKEEEIVHENMCSLCKERWWKDS